MPNFDIPTELYMSSPVKSVAPSATLEQAHTFLQDHSISCAGVVDDGVLVGLISRTDLLRVGRRDAGALRGSALLTLPDRAVSEIMSSKPATVSPNTPLAEAATVMWKNEYHRVFAVDDAGRPVGVLSTRDVMVAIRDKRVNQPIAEFMSAPLFTVRFNEPISLASERLEKARVSGLIVVDEGWPVGLFTQIEALESRHLARDTAVEEVMNTAFICMPEDTRIFRAAQQAEALRARRIIAVRKGDAHGILTGIDFAHCAAG